VRVWLDRRGQPVLGEGRAELLEAIGKRRSITAAARAVGMSYRKAWTLIREVNEAAGEPLVRAAVGGAQGGGAQLTERGYAAVEVYRRLHASLQNTAGAVLTSVVAARADDVACLHVAAAVSFQEARGQVLAAFKLHRPLIRVRCVFGASNELADQLLGGAPGDVFISADATDTDRLESAGRLATRSRRTIARNGLVGVRHLSASRISALANLVDADVRRVALADPACPLGRLSKHYLESRGVYDRLEPKILHVDNSRAVLSAIASGVADAGVAFASDAEQSEECAVAFLISAKQASTEYVAGIVAGAGPQHEAEDLLQFLLSPIAARCLRRCGLRPPRVAGD
jgi:molybdenum ABC transporter molybdate-binding protein